MEVIIVTVRRKDYYEKNHFFYSVSYSRLLLDVL